MLKGKAAKPQFRFGNRHPGTSIPFTFDIPENLLQECGRKFQFILLLFPCKTV